MKATWLIKRWHGIDRPEIVGELPGHLSEAEVSTALQRLVCRNLSEAEIFSASLRRGSKARSAVLDRVGMRFPIMHGENPHYTAEWRAGSD